MGSSRLRFVSLQVSGLCSPFGCCPSWPLTRRHHPLLVGRGRGPEFWLRDVSTPLRVPLTRAAVVPSSDSFTGELALKIEDLLAGVQSQAWVVLLRDWDRSLRAGNHPETTRYNYVLAASQLAEYLGERMPEVDGACNPSLVDSGQVAAFQAAVIEERSAGTGLNKYKALQQFFRRLVIEGEVERSPMDGVPQPTAVQKIVEVLSDEETRRILEVYEGRGFVQLRDQALVRMFFHASGRLAEIGDLLVPALDLEPSDKLTDLSVLAAGKRAHLLSELFRQAGAGRTRPMSLARYYSCRSRNDLGRSFVDRA